MGLTMFQKIIKEHLVDGRMEPRTEIGIRIDQTLTQDATGTMALLEFERLGIPRVRTELSVNYVDHNILQVGHENADDHRFIQTMSAKYGMYFSRPGNGICHQVHLERFSAPGKTLLGSDSHTPMAGAMGMVAIGAGGLDVALAMAGQPYYIVMPRLVKVELKGRFGPWVSAKEVILELLRRLSVKGGVGKVFEFVGEGVKALNVYERATIANMVTELGATTGIFPSDEQTLRFLRLQRREDVWKPLQPDPDAQYDEEVIIDLAKLEPLIALPHSPDNVKPVREVEGLKVDQVCVGSCNNSSYRDLMIVATALKGRLVHPNVSFTVSPGSRQVLELISRNGALADMVRAGVRVLEAACGPCIGMGQAPPWGGVSIRTFNRNFEGRSGTPNARVFLASPEVAVAAGIFGEITDPRKLGEPPSFDLPDEVPVDDSNIFPPSGEPEKVEIVRGPNIKPLPEFEPIPEVMEGVVLLKVGDNITTDHILPAGAHILPLRSNIPKISEYTFTRVDREFPKRAKELKGGFVVGGHNYGQGSSREHAAIAPRYLGLKAVLAKSFARIHHSNLANFGILPLVFLNEKDYELIEQGDKLRIEGVRSKLERGEKEFEVRIVNKDRRVKVTHNLTERQVKYILTGSRLNYVKGSSS
jgi:aconitate hydratase